MNSKKDVFWTVVAIVVFLVLCTTIQMPLETRQGTDMALYNNASGGDWLVFTADEITGVEVTFVADQAFVVSDAEKYRESEIVDGQHRLVMNFGVATNGVITLKLNKGNGVSVSASSDRPIALKFFVSAFYLIHLLVMGMLIIIVCSYWLYEWKLV
jgi:hypothetical protein